MFSILEILILVTMPFIVALMVAVHAWAAPGRKVFSLVCLQALRSASTSSSLPSAVSRRSLDARGSSCFRSSGRRLPTLSTSSRGTCALRSRRYLSLRVFGGSRLATRIRVLMLVSGAVALAGLGGVIIGDMRLRNIGVIGYAVSSRSRRSCSQSCSSEPLPRR